MAVDLQGSERLMSAEQLLHSISFWKQRAESAESSLEDANAKIIELNATVERLSEQLDCEKSARFVAESTSRIMNKKHSTLTGMITELSSKNEELEDKLKRLMRDPSSLRASGELTSEINSTISKKRSASAVSFRDLISGMTSSMGSSSSTKPEIGTKSRSEESMTSSSAAVPTSRRTAPSAGRISVDATVMDDTALFGISEATEMDTTAIEDDLSDLSLSGSAPAHSGVAMTDSVLISDDDGESMDRGRVRHRRLSDNELAVRAAAADEEARLGGPMAPPITPLITDVDYTPVVLGDADVAGEVEPVGDGPFAAVDVARLGDMMVRRSRSRSPSHGSVRSDGSISLVREEDEDDQHIGDEEMDQHGQAFVHAEPAANQNNVQNQGNQNNGNF